MNIHSIRVVQDIFDEIRGMQRAAVFVIEADYQIGDRLTITTSDEASAIDRYVALVEPAATGILLVHFVWPLREATKALVHYCDTAESPADALKMFWTLDALRDALK